MPKYLICLFLILCISCDRESETSVIEKRIFATHFFTNEEIDISELAYTWQDGPIGGISSVEFMDTIRLRETNLVSDEELFEHDGHK